MLEVVKYDLTQHKRLDSFQNLPRRDGHFNPWLGKARRVFPLTVVNYYDVGYYIFEHPKKAELLWYVTLQILKMYNPTL